MYSRDVIKQLVTNGARVEIHFSEITNKWYLSTNAEVKRGCCLISPVEHEDTPAKAIESFCKSYKNQTIVLNAYSDRRKEFYIV